MMIRPCDEPVGEEEQEYFTKYRAIALQQDIIRMKEKFKYLKDSEGWIRAENVGLVAQENGVQPQNTVMLFTIKDFARHIRQVEWLLHELQKQRE